MLKLSTYKKKSYFQISSDQKFRKFGSSQKFILGTLLFSVFVVLKNTALTLSHINQNKLCLNGNDSNLKVSNKSIDVLERIACNGLPKIEKYLNSHNLLLMSTKLAYYHFKHTEIKVL